jgi:hypothetical protein
MAHFTLLDNNNVVIYVTVGKDTDTEEELSERTGQTYKQTSYNTRANTHFLGGVPFRKNYAGIGYTYDAGRDAFIPQKPFASWTLDEETCLWNAPVEKPIDAGTIVDDKPRFYNWDEENQNWVLDNPI